MPERIASALLESPGQPTEAIDQARQADLRRFVRRLVEQHAHLWPTSVAPGRRLTNWPRCWELHPGFVAQLRMLKGWSDAIDEGLAESYVEVANAFTFIRHDIAPSAHAITTLCREKHRDPSLQMPTEQSTPQGPRAELPHWSSGLG